MWYNLKLSLNNVTEMKRIILELKWIGIFVYPTGLGFLLFPVINEFRSYSDSDHTKVTASFEIVWW